MGGGCSRRVMAVCGRLVHDLTVGHGYGDKVFEANIDAVACRQEGVETLDEGRVAVEKLRDTGYDTWCVDAGIAIMIRTQVLEDKNIRMNLSAGARQHRLSPSASRRGSERFAQEWKRRQAQNRGRRADGKVVRQCIVACVDSKMSLDAFQAISRDLG